MLILTLISKLKYALIVTVHANQVLECSNNPPDPYVTSSMELYFNPFMELTTHP